MTVKIEVREILKQKEIHESINGDYSFNDLSDQRETEIQWVKLHQMFDR